MRYFYLFIYSAFVLNSLSASVQPDSETALCSVADNFKFKLIMVASELDFYKFELIEPKTLSAKSFWNEIIHHDFIVDYSYKFGNVTKTESRAGYYLLIKPLADNALSFKIHKSTGSKVLMKSLVCKKN